MIKDLIDFRGGYATDLAAELMADNECLKAENCQWRGKIKKRAGYIQYSTTDLSGFVSMRGYIRAYINGAWTHIVALDDDSNVNFYQGTGTTVAAIDNTFDWTKGKDVEFAELNGYIVAVNGTDKPAVIYYSGGWVAANLETLDERTWDDANYWAGQWDDSGTGATQFIDDTTDAQDAGVDDFQLGSATNNDGFYISCDFPFTKVVFTEAQQAAGAPVAEYKYWNGTAWTSITPTTAPTWTDAEADKTLEIDIPQETDGTLAWDPYGELTTAGLANKYILRCRFTTAATGAFSCDDTTVSHAQYLTQIMEGEIANAVVTHGSRIHLAANNIVNISPLNAVKGWRENEVEYFKEGGNEIMAMVSYQDALMVVKENTLYRLTGNSYQNWVRSEPLANVGTCSPRSVAVVGDVVVFVGLDGIYIWNGTDAVKVSGHIQTDFDALSKTVACSVFYKHEGWISFPSESTTFTFDPDTYRTSAVGDDIGEGKVSFFKFTSHQVASYQYCQGADDTGYLLGIGIDDDSDPCLVRCDTGTQDNLGTAANITMKVQTKYLSFMGFQLRKLIKRIKIKLDKATARAGDDHTFIMYADDGTQSKSITIETTVGASGYYEEDITPPYTMDGKNLSLYLEHSGSTSAGLVGYAIDVEKRSF